MRGVGGKHGLWQALAGASSLGSGNTCNSRPGPEGIAEIRFALLI